MEWIKKGLIYGPSGELEWAKHSALQPTPLLMNNGIIRIFVGFRDNSGVGRVGYVDVSADNPKLIIKVSQEPVLDIGLPGAFDDNGVIPCAVVSRNDSLYLYYAGYQLSNRVRFLAFSGLAISDNGGENFIRVRNTPILERTNEEFLFRVIHSALYDNGVWKVWYGAGNRFIEGKEKTLPVYNIRYMESSDGLIFPDKGKVSVDIRGDEYRVGRPYVIKSNEKYKMFFSASTQKSSFRLAYAESADGFIWARNDEKVTLTYDQDDFDFEMSCYPAIIQYADKLYMFYNGNQYGRHGFGYAEAWGE